MAVKAYVFREIGWVFNEARVSGIPVRVAGITFVAFRAREV